MPDYSHSRQRAKCQIDTHLASVMKFLPSLRKVIYEKDNPKAKLKGHSTTYTKLYQYRVFRPIMTEIPTEILM